MSAINQLIAQGFGSPMGGGQGSSGYANALASMRNAQLQHQMQRERFAFEKQKFDAEQAALQRAAQLARENQLAAASYNFAGSTSPTEVLAYGEPGQNALAAYYKQQEVLNKQEENAFAREKFGAEKSGREATTRKTLADAAKAEREVSSQDEQDAINVVLGMPDPGSAMTALKQLTAEGRISEPKAMQIAANMGAYPSMDALRQQFDIRGLTPQQRLEQKTRSVDLGGIRREITDNPYGIGTRKTEDMSVTMTPAELAASTRANIAETRLQRQEEWNRQTDRWTKDREDQKLELDRQRTQAGITKDKSAQAKTDLEVQKLQSEIDEANRLKDFINQTGFDLNDPEDRKKLSTTEQGRAILKSNDDLQTSNINRQISQINLELKNQELAQNEEDSFVGKLGIATTADSLRSLFDSAFNNPVLAKELEKHGVKKDELDKLLSGLTTPEQVKQFVREFQSQALADNKVSKERLATEEKTIRQYEYAVSRGYKGSYEEFLQLGDSETLREIKLYEYAQREAKEKGIVFPFTSITEWILAGKKAGATNVSQAVEMGKIPEGEVRDPKTGNVMQMPGSKTNIAQSKAHAEDIRRRDSVKSDMTSLISRIDDVLKDKGFSLNFGGYPAHVTQFFPQALNAKSNIESIKDNLKNLGLAMARVGGSIGQITEREWKTLEGMINKITPEITQAEAIKRLRQIQERASSLIKAVNNEYVRTWGKIPQYYEPSENRDQSQSAPKGKPWEKFRK